MSLLLINQGLWTRQNKAHRMQEMQFESELNMDEDIQQLLAGYGC